MKATIYRLVDSPVILHVKNVLVIEKSTAQIAMTMLHCFSEDEVVILDMLWPPQTHRTEIHVTQDVLIVLEPQRLNEPRVIVRI